eukprot:1276212-Rhodomonas_salina.3
MKGPRIGNPTCQAQESRSRLPTEKIGSAFSKLIVAAFRCQGLPSRGVAQPSSSTSSWEHNMPNRTCCPLATAITSNTTTNTKNILTTKTFPTRIPFSNLFRIKLRTT